MPLTSGVQDIRFKLSHTGAEVESEAVQAAKKSEPINYVVDGPFLIMLRKRGAELPFFVMWIENDELLAKW